MLVSLLYTFALYSNELLKYTDFNRSKVIVSFLVWRSFIAGNWLALFLKRNRIKQSLLEMKKQQRKHKLETKKRRLMKNIITLAFLSINVFITFNITAAFYLDENLTEKWFNFLTFGYYNDGKCSKILKVAIAALFFGICKIFIATLPLLVSLFYIYYCIDLRLLISNCNELLDTLSNKKTKENLLVFIRNYSRLHCLAMQSESALSTQVLFLVALHFTMVFIQFSKLFRFHPYSASIYIENSLYPVLNTVSFFAIIYFASEVHRQDGVLRRKAKDVVFRMWLQKGTRKKSEVLRRFINSKRTIVFSACGMFNFERQVLIHSLGILCSYNLLILQLNRGYNK
ncbi:hypothetical protein JTE90_018961 [Oedothorax gibbosus]|uniref:Gustatory receptor n=1 Tax=Oedothorax gibbosus TaxID=931172 RepID=A0AAV6V1C5_9ARAC|nr:hypothetical protein JTE90_018961 [Oedothorax gibbosus]